MKPNTLPSYQKLAQALDKTALKLHPSQVHGFICGMASSAKHKPQSAWQNIITGKKSTSKIDQLLAEVYLETVHQLNDASFFFQLLLPTDNESLVKRAEALMIWCQGYLTGLKLVNIPIINRDPSEITNAIDDIIEIAKMDDENIVGNEEDENAYVQLLEYVRMVVIFIYQEMYDDEKSASPLLRHYH